MSPDANAEVTRSVPPPSQLFELPPELAIDTDVARRVTDDR